ncbi:unnamed protein product [Triticum turgidum subsp. durum]|uniref:F-box domain-containing protein n=1 Tax=Triticum turgidum subsp. durum TaxID=4567 RepID=A0A9R0X719_TRITD|nr:unnamed protein product [Triticum turgidum subsp. durum]
MAMAGPSTTLPPPPPEKAVDVLPVDSLRNILRRLSLADLLRAALACHRWRRVAARCLPRTAPLLGHFYHPTATGLPPPLHSASKEIVIEAPAVFAPLDASAPNLSLDFAPEASRLLLLEPLASLPKGILPRLLVIDPATRRRVLLPPPPRDTVPDDHRWRSCRHYVGSGLLSRAHPSKLCFEVVCISIDGGHPRAWVASVDDDQCRWRALPRTTDVEVSFDPWWFESRCVHAAGKLYWHICNSGRVLSLDPSTLHFSYLLAPKEMPRFGKFRIGETPDDGWMCIATVEDQLLRVWVRGETRCSDDGWYLEREMNLTKVYDSVPGLPKDKCLRIFSVWLSDMDAGYRQAVHQNDGVWALLLTSGHRQDRALAHQTWQGVWAPDVRLLPRVAACLPRSRELTFW